MELIAIGKIIKARGIKGEMKVYPYTEPYCMDYYCKLKTLWMGNNDKNAKEYKLLHAKVFKECFLFSFQGIDSPEKVANFLKNLIFIEKNQQMSLQKGEIFVKDLIGSEVFQLDGKKLGVVTNFFHNGANGVCEVAPTEEMENKRGFLFPTTKTVLRKVIEAEKKIIINPLEGLI